MEQKFVNEYRKAFKESRKLTKQEIQALIIDLLDDVERDIDDTGIEPLVAFLRKNLRENHLPLNWFTNQGLEKVFNVEIPNAVIIGAEFKLGPDVMKEMAGTIYIKGNRALIFHEDKMILADVHNCEPAKLAQEHNPQSFAAAQKTIARWPGGKNQASSRVPSEPGLLLDFYLEQAMGLAMDEDSKVYDKDDDDQKNPFREFLKQMQSDD